MRNGFVGIVLLFVLLVAIVVGYSSIFTVNQTDQALQVRLGDPIRVITEPGLNFKAPFIDTIITIDKRILEEMKDPLIHLVEAIGIDVKHLERPGSRILVHHPPCANLGKIPNPAEEIIGDTGSAP